MTILKFVTGVFAVFLVTVVPVIIRCDDICEESLYRVEAHVTGFLDGVKERGFIEKSDTDYLKSALSLEPDVYEDRITVGVRYLVPGGGSYSVDLCNAQITEMLGRGEKIFLKEGDTVRVEVMVTSPSVFSRIAHRYASPGERAASAVNGGRRIGWK